jgi:molybdopterin molybdotransferase
MAIGQFAILPILPMLSIAEALDCVRRHVSPLPCSRLRLSALLGLRLAEDITSRVDSPPFDKSVVDGFAIATSYGSPTLRVIELVTAGSVPTRSIEPGTTIRVMTGAPIPAGADAVVKWEDCDELGDDAIRTPAALARPGSCVLQRGASFHAGQVVLAKGKKLGAIDIALLAEIGQAEVAAYPRLRVGVLATGDELVEAHEAVGPGQIRNSNGPMLLAGLAAAGATGVDLGVARDDPADLREKIARGIAECDVLLVSGGVSAGVKDLAPGIFVELGVEELFHQVRVKPGKPLWFGVSSPPSATGVPPVSGGAAVASRMGAGGVVPMSAESTGGTPVAPDSTPKLVFGLPGNPVSTFVSFKLFVEPALAALAGAEFAAPATRRAVLASTFKHRGNRPTYQPCRVVGEEAKTGRSIVEALDWKGSADLVTLTRSDCLAALPEGDYELVAGDVVDVLPL